MKQNQKVSFKHNGTDEQVNSKSVAEHTKCAKPQPTQGSSTELVEWTQVPTPNLETTCNLYPPSKGKSVFSNRVSLFSCSWATQNKFQGFSMYVSQRELFVFVCLYISFVKYCQRQKEKGKQSSMSQVEGRVQDELEEGKTGSKYLVWNFKNTALNVSKNTTILRINIF